jgi:hypothetical protein
MGWSGHVLFRKWSGLHMGSPDHGLSWHGLAWTTAGLNMGWVGPRLVLPRAGLGWSSATLV